MMEVPVAEDCELPTAPTGNALGPPLPGHGLFAVPLGSTGVAFVSESGCKRPQVSEIAPGALLAAWAPPHPDWMNNLLAVATAKELQLFDVQVDESSVNARRPVWAIPIKQRLRQIGWRPEDPLRTHYDRIVLCASSASEVTLVSFSDGKGEDTKTRTLSFPDPVDGWTWVSTNGPPQLVVMSGGRLHDFGSSLSTAEDAPPPPPTTETLTTEGPAVRGRCIGVVGGAEEEGGAQRLLMVTSGPCGLEQGLRQRQLQTPAMEQGVLNATLLELRRTQRPLGLVDMQQEQEQQVRPAMGAHEAEGATEGSGGVIDLVGKIGPAAAGAGADASPNSSIPAGLFLHNLGGLSLEGRQQPRSAQQDTLSLARCPPPLASRNSSPLLDDTRSLASAPLQPLLGPDPSTCGTWSAGMLAAGGDCVVVGSHLSPTLLAYRLRPQQLQQLQQQQQQQQRKEAPSPSTFQALPPLVLPDGFRARGLALLPDGRRAFCLAARRYPQPEGGGPAVLTGRRARYQMCMFAFDLGGAGDGGQGQGQGCGEGAAAVVVNEKGGQGEGGGEGQGEDSVVLAFLKEFRGEVLGRLAALEAAVAAQGERLARLEGRWREGREL